MKQNNRVAASQYSQTLKKQVPEIIMHEDLKSKEQSTRKVNEKKSRNKP